MKYLGPLENIVYLLVTAAGLVALQLEPILVRERNLFRQAGCKAAFIYASVFSKYVLYLFKLILVQNIEHNSNRHHKRHIKSLREEKSNQYLRNM